MTGDELPPTTVFDTISEETLLRMKMAEAVVIFLSGSNEEPYKKTLETYRGQIGEMGLVLDRRFSFVDMVRSADVDFVSDPFVVFLLGGDFDFYPEEVPEEPKKKKREVLGYSLELHPDGYFVLS